MSVVEARLAALEARVAALEAAAHSGGAARKGGGQIADARELDSPFGDPVVKKDPPRWTGPSFAGCNMSQCSSEYLLTLAEFYDWQGDKDDESGKTWTNPKKPGSQPVPSSSFKRKDAAKARGWAERNKNAKPAASVDDPYAPRGNAATADDFSGDADDSIPF